MAPLNCCWWHSPQNTASPTLAGASHYLKWRGTRVQIVFTYFPVCPKFDACCSNRLEIAIKLIRNWAILRHLKCIRQFLFCYVCTYIQPDISVSATQTDSEVARSLHYSPPFIFMARRRLNSDPEPVRSLSFRTTQGRRLSGKTIGNRRTSLLLGRPANKCLHSATTLCLKTHPTFLAVTWAHIFHFE